MNILDLGSPDPMYCVQWRGANGVKRWTDYGTPRLFATKALAERERARIERRAAKLGHKAEYRVAKFVEVFDMPRPGSR